MSMIAIPAFNVPVGIEPMRYPKVANISAPSRLIHRRRTIELMVSEMRITTEAAYPNQSIQLICTIDRPLG